MDNKTTNMSAAHKEAAKEHKACADYHLKAADQHDHHKDADAKVSSKSAMACCETANKHSNAACAGSAA
jgi:hypothetical protein